MSNFGFVYMLSNDYMPDVCKIGCTERSPHARAEELSKPTGVPAAFRVVCFIEVDDFQVVERNFHKWLEKQRINNGREFFSTIGRELFLVSLFEYHPEKLSYSDVNVSDFIAPHDTWETTDPWAKKEEPAQASAEAIADQAIQTAKAADDIPF